MFTSTDRTVVARPPGPEVRRAFADIPCPSLEGYWTNHLRAIEGPDLKGQLRSMNSFTPSLLDLRILILTLGEARHAGWWKSQFLSPIGQSFLERLYPRSTFAAAVRSASRAARAVHDTNVGKGEVFHLFRLPRQTEQEIDSELTEKSKELTDQYSALLADRGALLQTLELMTSPLPAMAAPSLRRHCGGTNGWR